MLVLGIDTSSASVVVGVHDGSSVLVGEAQAGDQAHGELLAPAVARALAAAGARPADLDAVVVGVGPGPFTGLRVGIVTARVLGDALSRPALGVCSLDLVAAEAVASGRVHEPFTVVTDARRREVYVAPFSAVGVRLGPPLVARAADLTTEVRRGPVVGAGAALYPEAFTDVRSTDGISGMRLALVAHEVATGRRTALDTTPMYLRRPDAVENATRKRVTPS